MKNEALLLGASVQAGHYVTYLAGAEGWAVADDGQPPRTANRGDIDVLHGNSYVIGLSLAEC